MFFEEDEDYSDDKFEVFMNKLAGGMMHLVFALNLGVVIGALLSLCA